MSDESRKINSERPESGQRSAGPRPGGHGPGGHGPGGPKGPRPGEKPKDFKKSFGKMVRYCRQFVPFIIFSTLLAMAGSICALIGPDKLSDMTDIISNGIITGVDMDGVQEISFTLIFLYGISAVFSYIQSFTMNTVTQ